MNSYFLIIIIVLIFVYRNYSTILETIDTKKSYIIGIIENDIDIKLIVDLIITISHLNLYVKIYDSNKDMLEDLNNGIINFVINFEDNIIDSVLCINSYTKNQLSNINFVSGLYYNFYYFVSDVYYKDKSQTEKITDVEDLYNFYELNKRHYIIGTENTNSVSFSSMLLMLYLYGFKPLDIKKKEKNKQYDPLHIFYYTGDIKELKRKFLNDEIDGLFLVKTYNNLDLKLINSKKDSIFLNISFNNTIFDDMFSSYFYKKNINISNLSDDFSDQYTFETRSSRILLVSNKNTDNSIVYSLVKTIYENNNKIINLVTHNLNGEEKLKKEHNLFEPLEMAYINNNIPIHQGALNYYKKMNFIIDKSRFKKLEVNKYDSFKHYWKYDKIGINEFKIFN